MLLYFTDSITSNQLAINPTYVIAVFPTPEGEHQGNTVISLINGSLIVSESQIDVVGQLQGQLK
jgi:hypothetical protein